MAQQEPLDIRSAILQVFSDISELRRQGIKLSLAGRLGTPPKRGTHRVQSICDSRERGAQRGVRLGKIRRRVHRGEVDRTLPHSTCRPRHNARRHRQAVVRNPVVNDRELEPGGHLKCVGHAGIDVGMNGVSIAFVGVTAACGDCGNSREDRNDPDPPTQACRIVQHRRTIISPAALTG